MTAMVAVYNHGGRDVLHMVSLRHAVKMLMRNVALVREAVEGETFGPFVRPRALELVRKVVFAVTGPPRRLQASRANIMRRDHHTCAYCLGEADTFDHVRPRTQGGTTTWLNCVAACWECNQYKGGRTPAQAGMSLLFQAYVPTASDPAFALAS